MVHNMAEVHAEDLSKEQAIELPARELMAAVTLFGLPIVGVSDVSVNADTSGPGWLFHG